MSRQALMPQWALRQGEGWLSFRDPRTNFYAVIGGHAGISTDTSLRQIGTLGCPPSGLVLGCDPNVPNGDLGTGGGGSFGRGARVTPMIRAALVFTGEGGYRFSGTLPQAFQLFNHRTQVSVSSFQTSANLYGDFGGLLGTGRWNPYAMGGVGVAVNRTGDTELAIGPIGGPLTTVGTTPGSGRSHASFLWTVGGGVQHQLTPSSTIDIYYQYVDYVDAGRFQTGELEGPFLALQGNLRTHRIGAAVVLNIAHLAQLVTGR